MKERIIMSIVTRAMAIVPVEAARQLQEIIESELREYDVTPTSTAVVPYTGAPEALRYFLASKRLEGLAESSLTMYARYLTKFLSGTQKRIEDITTLDCKAALAAYRQSGAGVVTADTMRAVLKSFFSWCEIEKYVQVSPMRAIPRFKVPKRRPKSLTKTEMERIRCACRDARDRALVEAYYATGCRVSELIGVNRDQVDLGSGRLTVNGKGDKERVVTMTEAAILYLKLYLDGRTDESLALFVTSMAPHRRLSVSAIQNVFKRLGQDAGLTKRVHPHMMRHTRATAMLKANVPIDTIRQALGHAVIQTTLIYAVTQTDSVQAAMRETA